MKATRCSARARRPTPTSGTPAGCCRAHGGRDDGGRAGRRHQDGPAARCRRRVSGFGRLRHRHRQSARNLPGWDGSYALGADLGKRLATRVEVGNDVQVATWAEFKLGAGRGHDVLLGVFWGTGVGGGLVLNGEPWHGRGGAGEIGHMVVKVGGRRCPCGNHGCVEAYAGRAAMEAHARDKIDHGRRVRSAADHGRQGPGPLHEFGVGSVPSSARTSSRPS